MSQVSKILAWANARIGSHDYDGKCQRFVRQAYEAAGIKSSKGAANATEAWKLWVKSKSKTDIPTGATVYFVGSKPAIGHVGIYIGNGNIIHAAGDKGVKISSLSSMSGWRGWGFQAGKQPTGSVADNEPLNDISPTAKTKKDLSDTQIVSVTGSGGAIKQFISLDNSGLTWELTIVNRDQKIMRPAVLEGIVWETVRAGSPSILRFSVLKDSGLIFWEGDTVIFKVGGIGVFYGYIFKKSREKGSKIEVLAYDQLRYFKNKHTYVYQNKNAVQLLQMIASDFKLRIGKCDTPSHVTKIKIEDNQTLFDIIQNSLDDTLLYTGKSYVLWDDFGYLRLSAIQNREVDRLITEDTAEDFSYSSSIEDSANKVLVYTDTDGGVRQFTVAQNGTNITRWGVLQKTEKLNDGEVAKTKAETILKTYNRTGRSLQIIGAFGDIRVRAGTLIPVILSLGDMDVKTMMIVEKAVHTFEANRYTMNLDVVSVLIQENR